METSRWARWDRWMRALHLYTGLFLVPWMTVYAVSAFWLTVRISPVLRSRCLGGHRRRDHEFDDPVADLRHLPLGPAASPASLGRTVSDRGHSLVCDSGGAAVPLNLACGHNRPHGLSGVRGPMYFLATTKWSHQTWLVPCSGCDM